MAKLQPIPTPWKYRWRRVRIQWLPLLVFTACLVATVILWMDRTAVPNAVGQVSSVKQTTTSPIAGRIKVGDPLTAGELQLFATVKANQIIAVISPLDADVIKKRIDTANAQVVAINKQIEAKREEIKTEFEGKMNDVQAQKLRYQLAIDELELAKLRLKNEIADLNLLLKADRIQLKRYVGIYKGGLVAKEKIDELTAYIEQRENAVKNKQTQMDEIGAKLDGQIQAQKKFNKTVPSVPKYEKLLLPLHEDITVLKKQIEELNTQMRDRFVYAPISGQITEILVKSGQAVQPGQPVVTIASSDSQFIVAYVRQHQRVPVTVDMKVTVKTQSREPQAFTSRVIEVGAQYLPVPEAQLRDPTIREWGLPVKIEIKKGPQLKPGELVDLKFDLNGSSSSSVSNSIAGSNTVAVLGVVSKK